MSFGLLDPCQRFQSVIIWEIDVVILLGFFCYFFDLVLDFFVFVQFPFQEFQGDFCFFFQAMGRQHVRVWDFVGGALEAFYFDDALVGQLCEDVVGFAETDAHPSGHFPLGEIGVDGQEFQEFVAYFLLIEAVHGQNI